MFIYLELQKLNTTDKTNENKTAYVPISLG